MKHHHHDYHNHTTSDHAWNHPTSDHSHPDELHHHHGIGHRSTLYHHHEVTGDHDHWIRHDDAWLQAGGVSYVFGSADHSHEGYQI